MPVLPYLRGKVPLKVPPRTKGDTLKHTFRKDLPMRAMLPVLGVSALALTGCGGNGSAPESSPSPSESATTASPSASPSPARTSTPTPSPTTAAPEVPVPEPDPTVPVAPEPEAAPAAVTLPDPATVTPGQHCETYAPVSSGETQMCNGIAQGYIDPVTGGYIEQAPPALPDPVAPQPEPPSSIDDFDVNDPSTWQGVDENGNQWAAIPGPPPGV